LRELKERYGSWSLLAGAAEGLGEAWSVALAERGMNIIMVDHQDDLLQSLAGRLEHKYGIQTIRHHLDLAEDGCVGRMLDSIRERSCRFIIYNAAFSRIRRFRENSPQDLDRYLGVNARTPIQLVSGLVSQFPESSPERKGVILMASLAGLWGTKFLAPYGATKAFNILLAEALHHELKPQNFDVMACVAGATSTPAYLGTNPRYGRIRPSVMTPRKVADGALEALGKKALYIPGLSNRLTCFMLTRILSRRAGAGLFNRTTGKMYPGV
jgi:short-subunit dehydrogenase